MRLRILVAAGVIAAGGSSAWAAAPDLGSQVAAGKQLFETTCASSTCHGSGGVGASAPRLVDRNFSLDLVRTTVTNGRAGTPMPAFKDLFDPDMMASVIAYVLSVSTSGRWATVVPVDSASQKTAAAPFPESVAIGDRKGHPAAGYAVFFDATRMISCRTCHSYRENGGPVGGDFAALMQTPLAIYERISKPGTANPEYPAIEVTLRDGRRETGIKRSETTEDLRLVDVSSQPPVTRTFRKSDISAVAPAAIADFFNHATLPYRKQELLDAAAFLGKAEIQKGEPQKKTAPSK